MYARSAPLLASALALLGCEQALDIDFDAYRLRSPEAGAAPVDAEGDIVEEPPSSDGEGGPGDCTEVCGSSAACGECPRVVLVDVGDVSIDANEVTQAEYAAFLATSPSSSWQPAWCGFNESYHPATDGGGCTVGSFDPTARPDAPVVCVDWCDAWAFCAWARKRLCGARLGGPADYTSGWKLAGVSQWTYACTADATTSYPYGDTYDPTACTTGAEAAEVKSSPGCRGAQPPFDQVYDLSGNVAEWDDACAASTGANDYCRVRGGSYPSSEDQLRCDADLSVVRSTVSPGIGFRCCGP